MNDIEMIPLGKLRLSEANVRKNDSNLFIEELAANIEAKGLLQNLIVAPAKKRGMFDVTAGGRRLRALNFLLEAGKLAKDHPVTCRVLDIDAAEQSELSLIENVIRLDMTPTDEIRAYKHFVNEGSDLDAIAKRFGRTRRFIEGRLRLADLADPIFTALEEGKITLDVAKAYATTPNHERQMLVWNELSNSWQGNQADSIRRMITHSAIRSSSPMAKLASEADYLAAGGKIERDLFTEDGGETWIDAEIAQRIAGEKLQAFATQIAETSGYAWVRPILETRVTYNATEDLHQVHLEPAPLTEEEQAEADRLLEAISALEAESETLDEDDEAAAAEFQARWDAATNAYDALHDKPPVIPEEMKANVGCFVIIGANGEPTVASGLYSDKPLEKRKARGAADTPGGADSEAGEGAGATSAPKPLSQKLVEELAVQRRDILAINLASNPAIALDYRVIQQGGFRIGVFRDRHSPHVATLNFHGVTLNHAFPVIKEVHHTQWSVQVDIIDAPDLVLVLPARKEIYRNAALDHLVALCRRAIFSVIYAEPCHRLSFEDWLEARLYCDDFPPAARQLPLWSPTLARDDYREVPPFADLEPGAGIYDDTDSFDAVTFGRALRRSAGDEPHKLAGPESLAFYEPITNFSGYPWYDAIPCFVRTGECFTHDQGVSEESADALTSRPDAIRLELTDQHGRRLNIQTDFVIQESDDSWGDPDYARIALTRTSSLTPEDLTDLIIDAVFSPSDDSDADSYDTQETRFRHDAAVRAHAILEGEDAAIIAGIRMAFADRIAWRIPDGRKLSLTWSREGSHLTLADEGEGLCQ